MWSCHWLLQSCDGARSPFYLLVQAQSYKLEVQGLQICISVRLLLLVGLPEGISTYDNRAEYYNECHVSLRRQFWWEHCTNYIRSLEPLVCAKIHWTEQVVNDISLLHFAVLQAVYSYYHVPMSQAFLLQKAGDQDNHTLIVCGVVPCQNYNCSATGLDSWQFLLSASLVVTVWHLRLGFVSPNYHIVYWCYWDGFTQWESHYIARASADIDQLWIDHDDNNYDKLMIVNNNEDPCAQEIETRRAGCWPLLLREALFSDVSRLQCHFAWWWFFAFTQVLDKMALGPPSVLPVSPYPTATPHQYFGHPASSTLYTTPWHYHFDNCHHQSLCSTCWWRQPNTTTFS